MSQGLDIEHKATFNAILFNKLSAFRSFNRSTTINNNKLNLLEFDPCML